MSKFLKIKRERHLVAWGLDIQRAVKKNQEKPYKYLILSVLP
jgi:hypothetical protein